MPVAMNKTPTWATHYSADLLHLHTINHGNIWMTWFLFYLFMIRPESGGWIGIKSESLRWVPHLKMVETDRPHFPHSQNCKYHKHGKFIRSSPGISDKKYKSKWSSKHFGNIYQMLFCFGNICCYFFGVLLFDEERAVQFCKKNVLCKFPQSS